MLRIFLSVVLIFVANAAFASDGFEQYEENTSSALCYADYETVCSQDIDDYELDFVPSLFQINIPHFINDSHDLHDEFIVKRYTAFFSIRAPPHRYLHS